MGEPKREREREKRERERNEEGEEVGRTSPPLRSLRLTMPHFWVSL